MSVTTVARLSALLLATSFGLSAAIAADMPQTAAKPTTPPAAKPAASAAKPTAPPVVKLPAHIVARVGNRDITRDEVLAFVDMTNGGQYVDQLINNALLQQEAKRLGVKVSKAELTARVQSLKDQIVQNQMAGGTPMTFKEIAARDGFSEELIRWSAYTDLLRRKTYSKSIENKVGTLDNQRKIAHILFATIPTNVVPGQPLKEPTAEEEKKKSEEAKARIETLLSQLKEGKVTWEEAARQSDDRSNSQQGGTLGYVQKRQLDPAFEAAAWAIEKAGDIIGPVKSNFGWHLIKLEQKGSEASGVEKAAYKQQQIDQQLNNSQYMAVWLRELREKSKVIRNPAPRLVPGARSPASLIEQPVTVKPTAAARPANVKPASR